MKVTVYDQKKLKKLGCNALLGVGQGSIRGSYLVTIEWKKNKTRTEDIYLSSISRLPDSKVNLNFKEADLLTVVRLLASQENLNLVLGGDVQGRVTLKLDDVSLETAMDAILHVNGYEWFLQENIIIIKPSSPESKLSGELDTQIYRLRFVHGAIIKDALEEVLTDR